MKSEKMLDHRERKRMNQREEKGWIKERNKVELKKDARHKKAKRDPAKQAKIGWIIE